MQIFPVPQLGRQFKGENLEGSVGLEKQAKSTIFADLLDREMVPELVFQGGSKKDKGAGDLVELFLEGERQAPEGLIKLIAALNLPGKPGANPQKTKVTKEDFAALLNKLRDLGLSDKQIQELEAMIERPSGLNWNQLIVYLGETGVLQHKNNFSPEQKQHLESFFQKTGFTPQEAQDLIADLEDGKSQKVWAEVQTRLSGMSRQELLSVRKDEVAVLADALNLAPETKVRLVRLFSTLDKADMPPEEFKSLLSTITKDLADRVENVKDTTGELRHVIAALMGKAAGKEENLQASDRRGDDVVVEAAKIKTRENFENNTGKSSDQNDKQVDPGRQGFKPDGKSENRPDDGGQDADGNKQQDGKDQGKSADERTRPGLDRGESRREPGSEKPDEAQRDWSRMWDKVKDERPESFELRSADKVRAAVNLAERAMETADLKQAENARQTQSLRQQVLQQVQAGVLKNLGQGRHQLTLRLNPPELGHLQVVLMVKDKEVQAMIKADNHETGRILGDQLGQLRHQLEAQGLKVSKLEVQTQPQTLDFGQNWQQGRDESVRKEQERQENMRIFNKLRSLGQALFGEPGLEADAQDIPVPGRLSRGLDIVA